MKTKQLIKLFRKKKDIKNKIAKQSAILSKETRKFHILQNQLNAVENITDIISGVPVSIKNAHSRWVIRSFGDIERRVDIYPNAHTMRENGRPKHWGININEYKNYQLVHRGGHNLGFHFESLKQAKQIALDWVVKGELP